MAGGQPGGRGSERGEEFAAEAGVSRPGLLLELWEFMAANKKWWLTPVVLVLLLVGALIMLSGTAAAPFIYTLF